MDVVPVVASADEGGDVVRRTEADPERKNFAENAVNMRRRESWECILVEVDL